eukprot:2518529-Amphidinium_carterae.1
MATPICARDLAEGETLKPTIKGSNMSSKGPKHVIEWANNDEPGCVESNASSISPICAKLLSSKSEPVALPCT